MFSSFPDLWIALNIFLASALYLFDYVTNAITAINYHRRANDRNHQPGPILSRLTWIFPAILIVTVVGHALMAITFWLTRPADEHPLFQAFFFPLIQFWRLVRLLWVTCTCNGIRSLETELKPVYNILAAALVSCPLLILQGYIAVLSKGTTKIIPVSILAAFLNSAYNGALAVMFVAKKTTNLASFGFAVAGGLNVFASLLLRSLSFAIIAVAKRRNSYTFLAFVLAEATGCFAHFWVWQREARGGGWRRCMECIAESWMSFTIGPLYPMLRSSSNSKEADRSKDGRRAMFYVQLWLACMFHLLFDVTVCVCFIVWTKSWCRKAFSFSFRHLFDITCKNRVCETYPSTFILGVPLYILSLLLFIVLDIRAHAHPKTHPLPDTADTIAPATTMYVGII